MRKNLFVLALVAVIAALNPFSAEAQGLGGLLKKGKQALEKVSNTTTDNSNQKNTAKAVATKFENGIEMINPMAEYIDVTPVGLYGITTSENYGDAYLVLKVMMKEPASKASFGGSINNEKMIAVDASGKVYNTDSNGTFSFDTPEGIPVSVVMNQPAIMFTEIKKSTEVMPMVKFGILIDAYHKGNLTLKNVPIFWDETPE
ncbi:MAG: hypothetical protein HDS03_03145 [Bacteroides sp.]|nr:hypothetical protein [Bacteroides sp.]